MTTQQLPTKLPPDASAVQSPLVGHSENGVATVRRLNRRTVAVMAGGVLILVLAFLASQMLGMESRASDESTHAAESAEMVDEAEPAHIDEMMREQNSSEKNKPVDLRSQLEGWKEQQSPERAPLTAEGTSEQEAEDPWQKAREESQRRQAQAHFQDHFSARTSDVFPQVGNSTRTRSASEEYNSPENDLRGVRERADALRDWHRTAPSSARPLSPMPLDSKDAFFANRELQPTRSYQTLQAPLSSYEVQAGTILTLVLETGIDSDLPGLIKARFASPVYDTVTGKHLLIPSGAYLVGQYNAGQTFGQVRLQVAWTRLLLPNGKSLSLGNLPGTDLSGASGLSDQVDAHWDRIISGALLSSLFAGTAAAASGPRSADIVRPDQAALAGVSENINGIGQTVTQRNLDVEPTLRIRPGMKVAAFVREDLVLEPYDGK